uniref:Uncharacterized protein n=1 Tax=Quercus lobata TaxID=97700 RepID=A0A7N2LAN6_QUELO
MSSRTSALIAPLLLFFWLVGELRDEAGVGRASAGTASVSLRDGESESDSLREDDFISDISYRHQGYSWKPSDFGTLVLCLDYCIRLQVYDSMEFSNSGCDDGGESQSGSSSATGVVVLSTLVAVSGSYVFGTAVGYSSPAQSGIMDDLGLSVAEYSLFGSILTIGAMIGAIVSGQIVDYIGRRGAKIGQKEECEAALQHLRRQNADITPKAIEIREYIETLQLLSKASILDLFQWKYAYSLIRNTLSMTGFLGSIGTIAMVIVQIPMTALGVILMDKSGRRPLLLERRNLRRLLACGIVILLVGSSNMDQDNANFSTCWSTGVHRIFLIRHGRNSLGYSVRDISHKHERLSWKPSYIG